MDANEVARRKALQAAIANLCIEAGFMSMEKDALGTLTEIAQSYITEVGRTARVYSELASRTDPTVSDVHMALIDGGADVSALPGYAKRSQRRHLPRQMKNFLAPQPKSLGVGTKAQRPPNVPSHFPAFPDPHTYIKTPVFASPASDYKPVREKLASQKRNSKKGLSTLLAKTRPSRPAAGKEDPHGVYTVVHSPAPSAPLYLTALMPSPEDSLDSVAADDDQKSLEKESPLVEGAQQKEAQVGDPPEESMEICSSEGPAQAETFENPFLKPAKRVKLKIL